MTKITLFLKGVLLITALSTPLAAKEINIRVTNIDTARPGNILVLLFGATGYPKNHQQAIAVLQKPATQRSIEFCFTVDVAEFAIKVLHDENMDGQVTKNWTGLIPAEGLGFSKGATLNFGSPSFKRSKLLLAELPDTDSIEIKIIYPNRG